MNDYLREVAGEDFTAKDFRTWAGTVLAASALQEFGAFDSKTQAKQNVVAAIESVAELGNTPTVCRKCYVHPRVLDAHLDGSLGDVLEKEAQPASWSKDLAGLTPEEAAVLALLHAGSRRNAAKWPAVLETGWPGRMSIACLVSSDSCWRHPHHPAARAGIPRGLRRGGVTRLARSA